MLVSALSVFTACGPKDDPGKDNGNQNDPNTGDDYDISWKQTDIKMKLTENSNSDELTSGCVRYYAGSDPNAFEPLDNNIRTRNATAQNAANVKVTYSWIKASDAGKGWGGNINDMVTEVSSGSTNAPDIYCNFAYDMTCAALRGCFSNLLKTDYENGNYFRFTASDYNYNPDPDHYLDSTAGEGYFYNYMRSLSLTPDTQLYCLASDYTLDVMRAFIVVPVNVGLMNEVSAEHSAAGDKDGDGDHDINDFYKLVWEGGWNYSALAKYSNAIFQAGNGDNAQTDLSDNRVGFAIGKGSGLSSSGMLYTSSVKILEKKTDGSFTYPTANTGLNDLASALNDLFTKNASTGICVVTKEEASAVVPGANTELIGIRERFAANNVLFGGVIMVGSLEDSVYQGMKSGSGFGIVPVPVYKAGDEYKTLVHNIARIVAISKATTNFAQCSAFLDYQSRNSAEILDDYYNEKLTAAVGGVAGEQNAQMLTYISNHVNDCFDKTYEDAIANYMGESDPNAVSTRWHGMLMNAGYKMNSFSSVYTSVLGQKQGFIRDVYNAWLGLEK